MRAWNGCRRRLPVVMAVVALACPAVFAAASGAVVTAVELRTDAPLERPAELEELVAVTVGEPLDPEAVRSTLRGFQASGQVAEVEALAFATAGGQRLVFAVRTRTLVASLRFEGTPGVRESTLRARVPQRESEPLAESRVVRGVYELLELHRERGFNAATVRARVEVDDERKRADVIYRIEAGEQAEVAALELGGELGPFAPEDLLPVLRLAPGAPYSEAALRADAERLEEWLIGEGFRQAAVRRPTVRFDAAGGAATPVFDLFVGPRFEISLIGGDADAVRRRGRVPLLEPGRFDEAVLLASEARLRRFYQERGHYRVEVDVEDDRGDELRRVRFIVRPGAVYELQRVDFSGNDSVSRDRLVDLMATTPRRALGRSTLVDEVLEDDLRNIRRYYARQGFAAAVVGPPRIEEARRGLVVHVPIEEGRQQRVVGLEAEGAFQLAPERVLARTSLEPAGPFHELLLEESVAAVRALYEQEGFQNAQVSAHQAWNAEHTLVDITLRILEGPRSLVDRVIVRGNRRTRIALIRRAIGVEPGDVLTPRRLLDIQRRLYGLEIFSRVEVREGPATPFSARRDLVVRVEEARELRLTYGVGYDSEDGFRGLLGIERRNLFGRGASARADLRGGERERLFRALVQQPYIGRWRLPTTYSLFAVEEAQESFDSRRRGFQIDTRRPWSGGEAALLFTYKRVEVENPDPVLEPLVIDRDLREVQVSSLTPSILVDRRDDPLDPRRGWSSFLQTEVAFPSLGTDTRFWKLFLQQTGYLDLGAVGVLAASLRAGAIEPRGGSQPPDPTLPPELPSARVPISERFFAGGRTTHRAYRRDRLGIPGQTLLFADGGERLVPVGGNGLLTANLELRFPLAGPVGGTLFADGGNVWADWRDVDPAEAKLGVGVGVRYLSPIGPLRLEVGWKLDRLPGEDPAVLLLSFGYPF